MTRARDPNQKEMLSGALLSVDFWSSLALAYKELAPDVDQSELDRLAAELRVIPHEDAKKLTIAQIRAKWECDHHPVKMADREALDAVGISDINHPANLTFRPKREHREKTARFDIPAIAKTKRIRELRRRSDIMEARAVLPLTKVIEDEERRSPSRWPKGRKIQSRPFQRRSG